MGGLGTRCFCMIVASRCLPAIFVPYYLFYSFIFFLAKSLLQWPRSYMLRVEKGKRARNTTGWMTGPFSRVVSLFVCAVIYHRRPLLLRSQPFDNHHRSLLITIFVTCSPLLPPTHPSLNGKLSFSSQNIHLPGRLYLTVQRDATTGAAKTAEAAQTQSQRLLHVQAAAHTLR